MNALLKCALRLCALACTLLCALGPATALAAPSVALVTIVDGEAHLVRGATRHALAEGVRLSRDDIVETTPQARLLRMEFSDGVLLDLGPGSRVLIAPRLAGDRARPASRLHLLAGVAKLTVPKPLPATAGNLSSPALDATGVERSAVFVVQGQEAQVFAESGAVTLQERRAGKASGKVTVKSSEFYSRDAEGKAGTTARPTGAFIQRLPRAFMDTLPARAAVFASREVPPERRGELSYAEAEPWVDAEGLRAHFATRWRALAHNPAFRAGLLTNMTAHPEWDRILFPEKYLPKPPLGSSAAGSPAASAPSGGYGQKR